MPSLSAARQSNATFSPATPPVAIFIGGTSGIGQGTAQAFASHVKGNAHIILVGRNRAAAEAIIATFPKHDNSDYEFVHCDASLIRNIPETTSALLARLPKVNYLVLTCGVLPSVGDILRGVRHFTDEGLDMVLELAFYARVKFVSDLLPLLQKAKDAGEDARVLNVAAAGHGGPIDLDDMGLRRTDGPKTVRPTLATYTDVVTETFAARVPGSSFIHSYPGTVSTPIFPWWMRPLTKLLCTSVDDCGEYMLYALLNGGEGAQRVGEHGDDLGSKGYFGGDEVRDKVWAHAMEVIDSALATNAGPA